ncbi:cupin domain-containing protein [Mycolicibacterium sp. 018/SC-01/001]|uniref:cupin domain-containing protein n=1 Tax=Mycolicibacterium sp. 018/SC-01/001 TaxID=2592069 RepID=UPI001180797D|nr:cupin domain-containing protein [Mycolicibacterium sp. 018/SC-01/001]TRW84738.1 cupin domain-containing protein [Mycolicibacterium sp. 018/SC-01/001]
MTALPPNSALRAARVPVELTEVPADQSVAGHPQTGSVELGTLGAVEVGIWEMTEGIMTDVESDEIFVVLCGRATVEFADGAETLTLAAGDVVRLAAGARTTWTVTERLRKVYLT